MKRAVDIVLGTVLAALALPFVLLLCAISAGSFRRSPLFVQWRVGRDGRPFRILKIRTMPPSLPSYGHLEDFAVSFSELPAWSRVLRSMHLDELPQLVLVPVGAMSLVGPRPSQPRAYEHIDQPFESMRTTVRPGCTGLWQVGAAHDKGLDTDPEYDTLYLENMSLRLDLWLLFRTALFSAGMVRPITPDRLPRWLLRRRPLVAPPTRDTSGGTPSAPPAEPWNRTIA